MADISMITTQAGLAELAGRLWQEPLLACDLEADSLHRYREKVCLLQFSIPGYSALVDPLAMTDLSALAPVMASPAIRKVFHGADYDIRSLHRDFGIEVNNLFDTMIACQFLGEKEVGLAAALKKRFGVELNKRFQKADWSQRPLSPEMIAYAEEDTSLLIGFYRQLEAELRAKGRLAWVEEECSVLQGVRVTIRPDGPRFLRFKGAARLEPRALAVLEELLGLREQQAERLDRPPFKVLGGESLLELVDKRPRNLKDLSAIRGLPEKMVQRMGAELLRAVARGCALPAEQLPRYPFPPRPQRDPRLEERLKRLKGWRERKAKELAIDSGILANNALLEALAAMPDQSEVKAIIPRLWQRELFGAEVEGCLAGSAE
jgi:ribonuclease D